MESPAKQYQENMKSRPEIKKEAYPYFMDKYIKDPYNTSNDALFSTTERISAKTLRQFIPGKIYTFRYDPIHKDILAYYDKQPIILVCGQWVAESTGNQIVTGINLNFLPEVERVNTLEYYYQSVKSDLEKSYSETEKKSQVSFIKRALIVLQDLVQIFNVFGKAGKIGYQYAMRNYIIGGNMQKVSLVEYDDWQYIPFIQTKDIVGASLGEIHKAYNDSKNQLLRKQPPMMMSAEKKRKYNNR
jgi:hypothetical protein